MATNVIYTDMGFAKLMRDLKTLDKTRLRVGVVGAEGGKPSSDGRLTIAEEAIINYFGSARMNIPARKFLDVPPHMVEREMEKVVDAVLQFKDMGNALDEAGRKFAEYIRERILRGDFTPNQFRTIMKKGFDHPLMDTAGLLGAIGHELVRGGGDTVSGGASEYESFEVTEG